MMNPQTESGGTGPRRKLLLALDQGTTSSRAIVFDTSSRIVGLAQQEFPQLYPGPGLVEHDPEAIWTSQLDSARQAIAAAGVASEEIAAIGITNQRETTILWDRATGKPIANAIVWQSRVSAGICERLKRDGLEPLIVEKTGLVVDAYFSGTKVRHLLDTVPGARQKAERGDVLFGTVDTYLIWRLTGGKCHVTDVSNASRTMLFNIHTLDWDDELLQILDVPRAMLPAVRSSAEVLGDTEAQWFGRPIPIAGCAGDQQAATFGQACFAPGTAKNTYGTGCFLLLNVGPKPVRSQNRLLTTVGWRIGDRTTYCLEGSVFIGGAVVQWLRDGLRAISHSSQVEELARSVPDTGGVVFVPAMVGLGAPHWDPTARGAVFGITRDTRIEHVARAAVESMAFQSYDLLDAMLKDSAVRLDCLRVDGGAAVNDGLMQFQADLLGIAVERPVVAESTALGAAYLAGLGVGIYGSTDEIARQWSLGKRFEPQMPAETRDRLIRRWHKAVDRVLRWESDD